jgi:hypothetical protein
VTMMENITVTRGDSRREIMSDTGFESAAHDGDIDSDQEYRHRPLYYPSQADSASGSEFTVTNIDADELRKSQRKKKGAAPQILIQQSSSTYGSQDSDDDDDEASTPSGDNTDRNPMSLFSISSESLDQLGSREKYLQSTFESMSGAETELTPGKTSISSKFLTRATDINMAAINAVKQTKSDPEAALKRQLLNKKIAETKKKLESVGHSSPLRYSQSIHDLSHIPERDKWTSKKQVYLDESSPDSSLRRSCSLSDLSMQKPVASKNKIDQVSGKKSSASASRSGSRYAKNNAAMTRSRSSGVLNQSDSDNEAEKKVSRLMRPTISSHNKINKSLQNRKKQSYSTSNLNTVGVDNVSTSEEEIEVQPTKPAVPPRTRATYENGPPTVTPRRHLNNKDKTKGGRHTIHFEKLKVDLDETLTNEEAGPDLSTVEVSHQLCDDVIQELTEAADKVVGLYNRLNETETDTRETSVAKMDMVKNLEMSILHTHKILHDCIFKKLKQSSGNVDVNQTDTVKKLNDLVSKGPSGPNSVVSMMEQYSDILLDMVQQKIHNSNI